MLLLIVVNLVLCLIVFVAVVGGLAWSIRSARSQPELRIVYAPRRGSARRHGAGTPA